MPTIIHPPDEALLVGRALTAYRGHDVDHRTASVQKIGPRVYVVLERRAFDPIVYRVADGGQLRRVADVSDFIPDNWKGNPQ